MKVFIISPYPLQSKILIDTLERSNIQAHAYPPNLINKLELGQIDGLIFPHPITKKDWGKVEFYLDRSARHMPLIFLGSDSKKRVETSRYLANCVFIRKELDELEVSLVIKDTLNENTGVHRTTPFWGGFMLDPRRQMLVNKSGEVRLTRKEYFMLELLMSNPGQIISRERIVNYVWDKRAYVSPNTIEVYISRLRKKLNGLDAKSWIHTISCVGYEFAV